MDLMVILKTLFGGETLTFEQFAEKVNNAADVKLGLFSKHKILGGLLDLNCQATPVVISAGQYDKIASEHSFFVSILYYLLQIQLLNDNVIPIL